MEEPIEMKRELGLLDATLLVAGSMIGSGIFIVAAEKYAAATTDHPKNYVLADDVPF